MRRRQIGQDDNFVLVEILELITDVKWAIYLQSRCSFDGYTKEGGREERRKEKRIGKPFIPGTGSFALMFIIRIPCPESAEQTTRKRRFVAPSN